MQLIFNEQKRRYEFLYTKAEMGTGYPLVKANNFQFDGQANPKVWFTASARRAIKLASYADDALRERILRDAGREPDPDACQIEYHEHLEAPRAKDAPGFTWHAPYQLNPFVKERGWQYADSPDKHWWTTDAGNVRATCEAIAGFNRDVTDERMRVKLHVSEAARAEVEAQSALKVASITASRASSADIEIPCPEGLSFMPFQKAGVAYCLERDAVLLGDEMGLGKSIETIGVINADMKARKILLICPASLKINWRREIEKWCMRVPNILTLSGSPTSGREDLLRTLFDVTRRRGAEVDVCIINFDILHKWEAQLVAHGWDLLVIDEAHKMKGGKKTKRGAAGLKLSKVARRKLLLTGTPIPNRVSELLPLLEMLGAVDQFGGGWNFLQRYAGAHNNGFGWQFDDAAHLGELNDKLRSTVMIRRLKTEVLKELPRKRRQVIELPPVTSQQKSLIERERTAEQRKVELRQELRARVELAKASEDPDEHRRAVSALRDGMRAAFDEMSKLRHETAVAKLPQAIEHIEDMLEECGKIVLGAHHRDVIEMLVEHFNHQREATYGEGVAVKLYGGMSQDEKQASVDRFQRDPSCRLFVGSIQAAGVGLTLTAASTVILVELDWVPANVSQFEDRVLRIGQEADSVLVQHLVLEGSLDARMARTLIQKQEIADKALDHETGAGAAAVELPEDFDGDEELVLPEQREAGYAPEEIVRVRYEPAAYEERAATHGVTQAQIGLEALKMTPEKIKLVHAAVRELAGWCDGAVTRDGIGFNGTDAKIGHNLAARPTLTPKAAALARLLCRKYSETQLGGRYAELFS
jgi:SWI/SNF-related matrix-associated actin-dependent regulator of chromatin subfamily A-like protein 1